MPQKQTSISILGKMAPVVEEARRTFPDATTDGQALTRALFHWYHGREENSKSGSLRRIEAMLQEILDLLRRDNAPNTDTDHA